MELSLVGPAYQARSLNVQADRMVNLYAERADNSTWTLYPVPGTETWVDFGTTETPIRGQIVAGAYLWVVAGVTLYRVNQTGSYAAIGTVGGAGSVGMASNGQQIMIAAGNFGYIVTIATSTLAAITDPDYPGADWVEFMDGWFLFGRTGTPTFYKTALYDGTNIDALEFASAEGSPDNIVVGIVDHRELILLGEQTVEGWRNTGAADFPIERIDGAFMEHGIVARESAIKIDNSIFWLGADDKGYGMVWRADGYTPVRISTHAIEEAISHYPRLDDAYAWAYQTKGHTFYVLSFPSGNATWVYDAATQLWHERAFRNPTTGRLDRHRGRNHSMFAGYHVIGDHSDGRLYRLRSDLISDDGQPLVQMRQGNLPRNENRRTFASRLELVCETGIGLTAGQGADPQAMLQISNDGGHTWGPERWRSLGRMGEYERRVIWNRCGSGRQRAARIVVTDPVPTAWISVILDAEAGGS